MNQKSKTNRNFFYRTGYTLLRTSEELIETLEENQVQLQNMMTSKYIAFFYDEISTWQKRLSNVDQGGFQLEFVSVSQVINHMTLVYDRNHFFGLGLIPKLKIGRNFRPIPKLTKTVKS